MLSPVLAGDKPYDVIVTHSGDWYTANRVKCRFCQTVTKTDRTAKTVFADGLETPYDKLVIAIGSAHFIIPIAGRDLPGGGAPRS